MHYNVNESTIVRLQITKFYNCYKLQVDCITTFLYANLDLARFVKYATNVFK